jgi:hypothetical protein
MAEKRRKLNSVVQEVRDFIKHLVTPNETRDHDDKRFPYVLSYNDIGSIELSGNDVATFFEIVNHLHDSLETGEYFHLAAVQSVLEKSIITAIDPKNLQPDIPIKRKIQLAVNQLLLDVDSAPSRWEVHIPVEGLFVRSLPFSVGNIDFYAAEGPSLQRLLSYIEDFKEVRAQAGKPQEEIWEYIKGQWSNELSDVTLAKISVLAVTAEAARIQAFKQLQTTLDVINFFGDLILGTGNGGRVYLPGEAREGSAFSPAFRFNPESGAIEGLSSNSYLVGPFSKLGFFPEAIERLNHYGFDTACGILAKAEQDRNEVENRILTALQWAGRATLNQLNAENRQKKTDTRREEAFLLYAVSLESLLLPRKSQEITYRLSTRGAHLLEEDDSKRNDLCKRLIELYNVRSNIVHSGSVIVSEEDLVDMREYAKLAVITTLTKSAFKSMTKDEDFHDWFERRVLR